MTHFMTRWIDEHSAGTADIVIAFLADENGQDLIEYGLIVAFIALGSIATMKGIAANLGTFFGGLGNVLTSAV